MGDYHMHNLEDDKNKLTNPDSFGPGEWSILHEQGARAKTYDKMLQYAELVKEIVDDIKCSNCRNHATQYLSENPIEKHYTSDENYSIDDDLKCFHWSWKFHNTVNVRLRGQGDTRKKIISFEEAKSWFFPDDELNVCENNCGKEVRTPLSTRIYGWTMEKIAKLPAKLKDPNSFGPGKWNIIHDQARRAVTDNRMKRFSKFVKEIAEDLKCQECHIHATNYISNNPIDKYFSIVEDNVYVGCFYWSWEFHNTVNVRLRGKGDTRKRIISWEEVKLFFPLKDEADPTICNGDCGKTKQKDPIALQIFGWSPSRHISPNSIRL